MQPVATAGFALASAAYGALAAVCAARSRARLRGLGAPLAAAALVTAVWALVFAIGGEPAAGIWQFVLELARIGTWVVLLRWALSATGRRALPLWLWFGPATVTLVAFTVGITAAVEHAPLFGVISLDKTYVASSLLLAVLGLVLTEQVARNTRARQKWETKLVWLGVGALFAYDVTLFSASFLSGEIERGLWTARGYAFACVVPLFLIGLNRIRDFTPREIVSPRLAFYTTSLVLVGGYLFLVSTLAYLLRVLGGTRGETFAIVVAFAGLVALAVVAASTATRARLRVFVAKNFFASTYDYREEWLNLTARLARDATGDTLAERTVEAFKRLGRAGDGAIWVRSQGELKPAFGGLLNAECRAEPVTSEFARFLAEREWIVELDNVRSGAVREQLTTVPDWLGSLSSASAVVPLVNAGQLVAFVVLGRPMVERKLTWEDLDLLRAAARQAASYFALAEAADDLARERQFAAVNRFTAFLMHDLSNIVAQQRLIVDNAARHKKNPEFIEDAIITIDNTVRRTARLLEQLKGGIEDAKPVRADLRECCQEAVWRMREREPRPTLDATSEPAIAVVSIEGFHSALEHLIRNAQDATPPDGRIRVSLRSDTSGIAVEIADTGAGMSAEFIRDRLFRPFDTTKGIRGMGVGAFQVREFVRASGGDISVTSVVGKGTAVVIRLPHAR